MSIRIASRLRAVSTSVSPLLTEEPAAATFTVSAREPLLGELEGDAGPGGGLEEEVDDGLAAQRRHLLDRPLADFLERLGGVEDEPDLLGASACSSPTRSLPSAAVIGARLRCTSSTASRPSSSHTSTSTRSPGAGAALVVPTMSAWIGSSRPPRSTRTQSRMRRGRPKSAQLVERGAHGAAGVEHVVHDDDGLAVEVAGRLVSPTTGRGPTVWRSSR